ncbi:hypothetical protein RTH46_10250 [Pseudomonas sp. zfem004]|uniref:hypothetical protein n=1 Tax=Pseudomonas sp. zfem004 TaxID=3078199 RepID=UPI0029277BA4|nr:hypothetical protein [Pseudomonas sp. zfem004]MDU9402871.1 hypothetical protein [Pseudomonas sp. zfem004]
MTGLLFFIVLDVLFTLCFARLILRGRVLATIMTLFSIVMMVVYLKLIGGSGLIEYSFGYGEGFGQELNIVTTISVAMILFHAWFI